jgi:Ca2+-binding EF-hand superfamily protein
MSSVSSISTSSIASMYPEATSQRRQRPDASTMAENLFAKLDTAGKGYFEQSDLTSALADVSSSSASGSSTTSASELFSQLDSDGDGKVTQDELTTSLQKLADSLDSQFDQMRVQGAMSSPPPPPPPSEDDTGFTEEELTSQLTEISTDSARAGLISKVVNNFDAADTNQDGKVSFQEAMAYDKANPATSTSSSGTSTTSTSSADSSSTTVASTEKTDAQVFRQLMDLLRTYGNADDSTKNLLSTLVTSA